MSLKELLAEDLKSSMKNKETLRKSVITLIRAEVKQQEVDNRIELDDDAILKVIARQLKQRKDSLVEFEKAQRQDLIDQTKEEIAFISSYLPKQMNDEELEQVIKQVIEEVGAVSMKDIGKVMGKAIVAVQGKADGNRINNIVKNLLK